MWLPPISAAGTTTPIKPTRTPPRGWDYHSHQANKNATTRLATEYDDRFLLTGFSAAQRFHIHFHHDDMEDYEIAADRPAVRAYVQHMVKLVEEYEADRGSSL